MDKLKFLIVLFLLTTFLVSGCTSDEDTYQSAMKLIENNNYDEAIDKLKVIQNYKDSKEIIQNNTTYNEAIELFNNEDLKNALTKFESISNYRDSNTYISEINDVFSLEEKEKIYQVSIKIFKNNDLYFAKKKFEELGNYKDSKEYLKNIEEKLETIYQESIKLIEDNKCEEAFKKLDKIRGYKDTSTLVTFAKAYTDFHKYDMENKYFRQDVLKLLHQIDNTYNGDLSEKIVSFKENSLKVIEKYLEKLEPENIKKQAVNLIKNKKYDEATSIIYFHKNKDEEFEVLYNYSNGMNSQVNGNLNMMHHYFTYISPDYKGVLSDTILNEILIHQTLSEWKESIETRKAYAKERERKKDQSLKPEPRIGMSAQEVEESSWGKPYEINKTITQYGTSEQWVYSLDRYIYLDDGVVTAIQKSE
ncbi:hypothetical protein GOQ27_15255 [Clostridium sp. D2Q-11]|uniref:Lipoprotein n=1 Tax=Anaeromonas frigoriresistens TaxID=2683708 RepID=A0A942UZF3_9FIRM|nr:hypothetical protein [Anaeromonas frigoriresistens]MBS4539831.1 hypothetical protein [Anaeromonas frigoriresistens]